MGIYHYLFSKTKFETSYIPRGQKQAFSKRLKNMSAPSPCYVTQTPQREFAGAKLQKNIDIGKFYGEKVRHILILMENK